MGGYKHTNVGQATSTNEYLRLDQLQQLTPIFCAYGGDADVMSVSSFPTYGALVTGHTIIVSCPSANTTTSVVIKLNGLSAIDVVHNDGDFLSPGDVKGLHQYIYNGSQFVLMNKRDFRGRNGASVGFTSVVVFSGSVAIGPSANLVVSGSASFASATIYDGFNQVQIGYLDIPVVTVDSGRQLTINDRSHQLYHATTSVCSMTIPTCASVAFPIGTAIMIQNGVSGGVLSVSAAPTVTLRRSGTGSAGTRILSAACDGLFRKVDSDTWFAGGNGMS
jgi:hypothetical protein